MKNDVVKFFAKAFSEMGYGFDLTSKDQDLEQIAEVYQRAGSGFWVLQDETEGRVVGTVALRRLDEECAELKRFFLLRDWQGRGLGRKLLEIAMGHAKAEGFRRIRLDTTSKSAAAIHLFRAHGFAEIERYNDDPYAEFFFEVDLNMASQPNEADARSRTPGNPDNFTTT